MVRKSIKVEDKIWNEFKRITKKLGSNMSVEIRKFIARVNLDRQNIINSVNYPECNGNKEPHYFRIESGIWKKFMGICNDMDSNASKEIRKFIINYNKKKGVA